jgi:hypothetical protein
VNATSCFGVVLPDQSVLHVHADRLWMDAGALIFCEDRENPDFGQPGEPPVAHFTTMVFAPGQWMRTYAASIVDGKPLPVVDYSACPTLAVSSPASQP